MSTTVDFHSTLGAARIERRIKRLAAALKSQLMRHVPGVRFHTPLRPEDSGGVVVFSAPGVDLEGALNALYHEHGIGAAVFGGDLAGIRLCPHIYNTLDEMEYAARAVSSLIGDGPRNILQ
jgi:selenocysteine lyase/cysteine desulfurase